MGLLLIILIPYWLSVVSGILAATEAVVHIGERVATLCFVSL
jgi:hypothetical protein